MKSILNFVLTLMFLITFNCSSTDDQGSEPISSNPKSDLSLTKTVNESTPIFGDNVTFTLVVNNSGPDSASNISVKDILPTGYTYVGDDGATETTYNEVNGIWSVSNLSNGSNAILNIIATVNESGNYTNFAELIASNNPDPDSTPNNNIESEDDHDNVSTIPIEPSSVQVVTIASINAADGLAIDQAGNIYASNYGGDIVYKIDVNHNVSTFINNQNGAAGMVFDDQDNMYLARYESTDIVKVSAEGSTIQNYSSGIAAPIAVDFDSDGNLYTNNNVNSAITKIDINGNQSSNTISIFNNSSLTLDGNNNIYVSDYDSGKIIKIDANTNEESLFTNLPISGGIGYIIYSNGNFFATAITDQLIFKIDSSGGYELIAGVQFQAGELDGNGNIATFNRPIGVVASSDGEVLYVAQNGGSGAIRMITGY